MVTLPFGVNKDILINDLRELSWEAYEIFIYYSQILRDSNNKSNIIKTKDNQDPVTLADLKVNEIIIQTINKKYKNINWEILSEENVKTGSNHVPIVDWVWVLDPLDGTKDFIQGTGNYAMHLALNYRNKPYLGIVLIPQKNELWISDGSKTWCEDRNGFIKVFKMPNSKILQNMTIATSKNHRNLVLNKLIKLINFKKVNVMGSIGCKIASIIRGESDIYISLSLPGESAPKDWDFAAPYAILVSAGGAITNLECQKLSFSKPEFEQGGIIIASNNESQHSRICFEIKEIILNNNFSSLMFS